MLMPLKRIMMILVAACLGACGSEPVLRASSAQELRRSLTLLEQRSPQAAGELEMTLKKLIAHRLLLHDVIRARYFSSEVTPDARVMRPPVPGWDDRRVETLLQHVGGLIDGRTPSDVIRRARAELSRTVTFPGDPFLPIHVAVRKLPEKRWKPSSVLAVSDVRMMSIGQMAYVRFIVESQSELPVGKLFIALGGLDDVMEYALPNLLMNGGRKMIVTRIAGDAVRAPSIILVEPDLEAQTVQ